MNMSLSAGQLVPGSSAKPPRSPHIPSGPHVESPHCHFIQHQQDPIAAVICCMYIIFGLVYTLFGYRCFKAIMFLTGFTFGTLIVYLICLQEHLMPPYGNACVALAGGLMFGLITMLIQYVGLFMTGLHSGLLVAIGSLLTYQKLSENNPYTLWICISVLLCSAILFAILNLCWKKGFTIFGTSLYGGAVLATTVDYLVEKMTMINWVWEQVITKPPEPTPCWFSWIIFGIWPVATVIGFFTQCCITSTGIHHEESISARKKRLKNGSQRPRTREQRAEMRQRKYRYLYQVRTAHGDIISQSYVQALQKKAQCGRSAGGSTSGAMGVGPECSTLQSDATHLTILPGGDHPQPDLLTDSEDDHTLHTH